MTKLSNIENWNICYDDTDTMSYHIRVDSLIKYRPREYRVGDHNWLKKIYGMN